MFVYIYLASFLLLIYFLVKRNNNYWKSKGIPHEKPFLFFGNFYAMATDKEHFNDRLRAIYNQHNNSPYVGIHVFTKPFLMLRSPELIKKVLVKDFDTFMNRNIADDKRADPLAHYSMFPAKDSTWKNIRSKVSPVFTSGKLKLMFPLMKDCAEELRDYLQKNNGNIIEIKKMTKRYTVDVLSSCAFGINSYSLKNEDSVILKMVTQLFDLNSIKMILRASGYFFFPTLVKVFRFKSMDPDAQAYLSDVFLTTMKERKERKIVRNDLIDLLDHLRKDENPTDSFRFDDVKMASQAMTFFSAGTDTSSSMLTFTIYELAVHKDIQDRLRQEIQESYREHGDFTYESVQQMKYLDMVFNEALRKYPLIFLDRVAKDKYTFEETGLIIDKGTAVMIPTSGLHFDPEYFPEPEKFDPERFSEENKRNIKPFTFLPFGEGPRLCVGQRFAQLSVKTGLAYAIKDFAFEPVEFTKIPLQFENRSIVLMSRDGVPFKVSKI